MRVLLAILLAFTITTYASAGPFEHAPILADVPSKSKKPIQPPPPDPKKLLEALPIALAVKHCLALEGSITEQYKLIDAFNTQPDLDNLPKDMSDAAREKVMLYMMGRPDIADFGFLITDVWKTTPRNLRLKWDALVTIRLDEAVGFRNGGYPFAGNCKALLVGEVTKDKNGFSYARVEAPLAFDQTEAKLTYLLSQQTGYNWQVYDLLVNDVGMANYLDKQLARNISLNGLTTEINSICKKSSFSNLQCN